MQGKSSSSCSNAKEADRLSDGALAEDKDEDEASLRACSKASVAGDKDILNQKRLLSKKKVVGVAKAKNYEASLDE